MIVCNVRGCQNKHKRLKNENDNSTIQFHAFPKNEHYRKVWSEACGIKYNPNIKYRYVCAIHFKPSDYKPKPKNLLSDDGYTPKLNDNAVPTQHLNSEKPRQIYSYKEVFSHKHDRVHDTSTSEDNVQSANSTLSIESGINFHSYAKSASSVNTNKCVWNVAGSCILDTSKIKLIPDIKINGNSALRVANDKSALIKSSTQAKSEASCSVKSTGNNVDEDSIEKLRQKLKESEAENKRLREENKQLRISSKIVFTQKVEEAIKKVFTPAQINKILCSNKNKVVWTTQDVSSAVALKRISPKAYCNLKKNN